MSYTTRTILSGVIGLIAVFGCDRPAAFEPRPASTAAFPSIVGNYAATGTATVKTSFGSKTFACSATIDIPTQTDSTFAGTVTVLASGDCDSDSGTVAGVVLANDSVVAMAYASNGATVWQEAAARSGCTLVRSTPFTGALSGDTLAVAGSGAYDCPSTFGTYRVDVDVRARGTRS
ncbi:MAG TPA: hypothetical protein VGQ25_00875 [Gemmatimonadales bacterium]|jgi:hypothetical protein|nr:hypothetical protein [Gemmatimonadales bacterium]